MKSQTKPITETTIAPGEQATQLFKFKNISDDVWLKNLLFMLLEYQCLQIEDDLWY